MIDASASFRGYILNQVGFDLYMIVIIGIVQRILAYFLLIGLNRDKQK